MATTTEDARRIFGRERGGFLHCSASTGGDSGSLYFRHRITPFIVWAIALIVVGCGQGEIEVANSDSPQSESSNSNGENHAGDDAGTANNTEEPPPEHDPTNNSTGGDPTDTGDDPTNSGGDPTNSGGDPTDTGDDPTDTGDDPGDPTDTGGDPGDPEDTGDDPGDPTDTGGDPDDTGDDPDDPDEPACNYETDPGCPLDCQYSAQWDSQWLSQASQVVDEINSRRSQGADCGGQAMNPASPLAIDESLAQASRCHSVDMANNNFVATQGTDGSDGRERADEAGYPLGVVVSIVQGEILTPSDLIAHWMNFDFVCQDLMNPDWEHAGVGVIDDVGGDEPYWTVKLGRTF